MNFYQYYLIQEGGAIAQKLIVDLELKNGGNNLVYVRIPQHRLQEVKSQLDFIINKLITKKIIKSYPKFNLGSTRLASHIMGNKVDFHPNENKEIVDIAKTQKKTFGDIDCDVELEEGKSIEDIGKYLVNLDPSKFAYNQISSYEICTAFRITSTEVIQVDFVDVTTNRASLEYNQFSSLKDMTIGLKGAIRDILVKTAAKTAEVKEKEKIEKIVKFSKKVEEKIMEEGGMYSKVTGKITGHPKIEEIRYSLSEEGLVVKVIFKKIDLKGKELKTEKNIKLNSELDSGLPDPIPYSNLDKIASIIGLKDGHTLHHATEMLKEIKKFPKERKEKMWENVQKMLETKKPTETAVGTLTNDEYEKSLEILKPYFIY